MTQFRKKYERGRYNFLDARCIEASCFQPIEYQHRGATSSGSRSTGSTTLCCGQRAYRGCPAEHERGYDPTAGTSRRREGWRKV